MDDDTNSAERLEQLWHDPGSWKLGTIYICPEDPRLVVKKRLGWTGWTFNFAHRSAYLLLVAVMAGAITPAFAAAGAGRVDLLPFALFASIILVGGITWLAHRVGRD